MSYSAPAGVASSLQELAYSNAGVITVLVTNVLANPKILAKWKMTKAAGIANQIIMFADAMGNCEEKTDTGADTIRMAWYSSPDGVTWSRLINAATANAAYTARQFTSPSALNTASGALYFAFGFDMDSDIEGGNAKNIKAAAHFLLPYGYTIERLL